MSARQLADWRSYFAVERFGPIAGNLHAAITAKAVYDTAGVRKRDGSRFGYEDFVLTEPEPAAEPAAAPAEGWRMSLAIAHVIAAAQNHIAAGGR